MLLPIAYSRIYQCVTHKFTRLPIGHTRTQLTRSHAPPAAARIRAQVAGSPRCASARSPQDATHALSPRHNSYSHTRRLLTLTHGTTSLAPPLPTLPYTGAQLTSSPALPAIGTRVGRGPACRRCGRCPRAHGGATHKVYSPPPLPCAKAHLQSSHAQPALAHPQGRNTQEMRSAYSRAHQAATHKIRRSTCCPTHLATGFSCSRTSTRPCVHPTTRPCIKTTPHHLDIGPG